MKKILLSLVAVVGMLNTSCDMDLKPVGVLDDKTAIKTAEDCKYFRNQLYSGLRGRMSGGYVTNVELQMDQFNGLQINGLRGGHFANSTISPSLGDFSDMYISTYTANNNACFMISHAERLLSSLSGAEKADVERYIGEAKFVRAYVYWFLFDHFCETYTPEKADLPGMGLQIVNKYEPSADPATYPARSTMQESLDFINGLLEEAYDALATYEQTDASACKPNSNYLSTYAVAALQARIALATGDYQTAITKSQYVINSQIFPLAEEEAYINMWFQDKGSELIFVPFVDQSESSTVSSYCAAWNYWASDSQVCDYIPSQRTVDMYDQMNDIRYESFFYPNREVNFQGVVAPVTAFYKYPGNSALIQSSNFYKNAPKPFRTSEQYLILAEASASLGQNGIANKALNDLRKARIYDYEEVSYVGNTLRDEIRKERAKELIGEGFRMSDLRRWGLSFTRDGSYPVDIVKQNFNAEGLAVSYVANDYRYTWPIPKDEMDINPKLKGQQNRGWGE